MIRKMIALALCLILAGMCFAPLGGGDDKSAYTAASGGMTSDELELLSEIDVDNAWAHLEYLGSLGEKAAGSPLELFAQQYVYDNMMAMDLDYVAMESFPTASWEQFGTTMSITSPEVVDIPVTTYGGCYSVWGTQDYEPYSFGNENEGKTLVAPLVDVGTGTLAELDAIGDLDGRVALCFRDDWDVTPYPRVSIEELALHGASAAVYYGFYNQLPLDDAIKQDSVGGSIPGFSISKNSAKLIQGLMEDGPVEVRIDGEANLLSVENAESVNVVGYLYGSVYPDEYIVFSGHIDTWFNGTNDDCSGVAAVIEWARLFSEAKASEKYVNERTLVFMSSGAEESGGPSVWYDWIVGSYEFVITHEEVVDGLVLHLNADMIACENHGTYWMERSSEINNFVKEAITDIDIGVVLYYPIYPWTDSWSFTAVGGGSSIWAAWISESDPYYHSDLDTIAESSPEAMSDIMDFFTLMAIRADQALVLPIDFTDTVNFLASGSSPWGLMDGFRSQIPSVPSEAELFEEADAALRELRDQARAVKDYADGLRDAYEAAVTDEERGVIVAKAEDLNDALIDARQLINRWSMGQGGELGSWDAFIRTDQHVHDYIGLSGAIAGLLSGQTNNALISLEENIYTMEWAPLVSLETYDLIMSMMVTNMYWGDAYDSQQEYLWEPSSSSDRNIYSIYLGLQDESLPSSEALDILEDMRDDMLIPWLQEDLITLEWAWSEASSHLAEIQT